jgi:hypothetical protein
VGPAFGGVPQGPQEQAQLQAADEKITERICAGDAGGFFEAIKKDEDQYNVCGLPPTYIALHLLEQSQGVQVAYAHCPADEDGTSFVSICGTLLEQLPSEHRKLV